MKKLLVFSLVGSSLLFWPNSAKSEIIWGTELYSAWLGGVNTLGITVYSFNTETRLKGVKTTYEYSYDGGSTYINDFKPSTNNYDHM